MSKDEFAGITRNSDLLESGIDEFANREEERKQSAHKLKSKKK